MSYRNIKLIIEYKGTGFSGWQIQKNQLTIQQQIASAVTSVAGQVVDVIGAGRTDAGVHALGQVANFHVDHSLDPTRYKEALNFYLPLDIRVKQTCEVPESFHSRFDAKWRRYRYLISREKSAIFRELRWEHETPVDLSSLQAASNLIAGDHDFAPFCVVASRKPDNHCRIEFSRWFKFGPLLVYEIRGNRFLHGMVRSLVGAMMNVASENPDKNSLNLTLAGLADIIERQKEDRIRFTAPSHGLYLVAVGY